MGSEMCIRDRLSTGIAVGQTAGIGTTAFVLNKITNVAVGDSISVGAAITTVPVVSICLLYTSDAADE